MKIEFDVTQEDIDKAGNYDDVYNCLGCVVLNRILDVNNICMGGCTATIMDIRIILSLEFGSYLCATYNKKVKPATHSIDIPNLLLNQIGYFDKKGTTFIEDYVTLHTLKEQE